MQLKLGNEAGAVPKNIDFSENPGAPENHYKKQKAGIITSRRLNSPDALSDSIALSSVFQDGGGKSKCRSSYASKGIHLTCPLRYVVMCVSNKGFYLVPVVAKVLEKHLSLAQVR